MKSYCDRNNQIICADVFEGLSQIHESSVDLIFIDPPYNIGKKFDFKITKVYNCLYNILVSKWNTVHLQKKSLTS